MSKRTTRPVQVQYRTFPGSVVQSTRPVDSYSTRPAQVPEAHHIRTIRLTRADIEAMIEAESRRYIQTITENLLPLSRRQEVEVRPVRRARVRGTNVELRIR